MKQKFIAKLFLLIIGLFVFSLVGINSVHAQQEESDNPATWKYFRILARAQDDSVFIKVQDQMGVSPLLESYNLIVNVMDPNPNNQYIVIGDETDPSAIRASWAQISKDVQAKLLGWTGSNKENLNQKKLNYASVFVDVFKSIKIKDVIAPPRRSRDIKGTTAYINPYFQFFGGDALGIPLKGSIGFSFGTGTPYSFPLETDMVGGSFHILGAWIGVNTRIKELTTRTKEEGNNTGSGLGLNSFNNIYAPELMLNVGYHIPFGNFFEIGYHTTIDTGVPDLPKTYINTATGLPMRNNVLTGSYFDYMFSYPFRTLGSTRAKVYAGRYLGETHIGFTAREMRAAGSVFDTRIDATLDGLRNFQIAMDIMISQIGEGFALSSFAIGPSLRLSKLTDDSFGVLTVAANVRFKLGDFFDEVNK
ncbi:MAG: hypothetical protein K1X86_13210 [Ignavibacteria bacterium]|nr:hypothetical protein [Ignavibacteria bacterium]